METITKQQQIDFSKNDFIAALELHMQNASDAAKPLIINMLRYEKLDLAWRMTHCLNRQKRILVLQERCINKIMQQ